MAHGKSAIREEFKAAMAEHISVHGPDAPATPLLKLFVPRGVSQSTLFRWAAEVRAHCPLSQDGTVHETVSARPQRVVAGPAPSSALDLLRACAMILADDVARHPAVRGPLLARLRALAAVVV